MCEEASHRIDAAIITCAQARRASTGDRHRLDQGFRLWTQGCHGIEHIEPRKKVAAVKGAGVKVE